MIQEPYKQKSSIIHQAFQMAKHGVKEVELTKYITKRSGNPARVLKELKKGAAQGFLWDVEDFNGYLKITNVRSAPKL
jgi:hypothetical protein